MAHAPFKAAAVQAAPAFLDAAAGVEKAIGLMEEAAANGAKLIAFPECWIPGYPWWAWLDSPAWGMQFVARHFETCLESDGPEIKKLIEAAHANDITLVLGFSERSGGSLYIAQLFVDPGTNTAFTRRKLKATHVERTIFGEGDGSHFIVTDTSLGRVGQLCCWEHVNPLNKMIMFSQHEQIHVASWPSSTLYDGNAYALGPEVNMAASQIYAVEGQCFVLAAWGLVSDEMQAMLCDTDAKKALLPAGGIGAMIYGPDGRPLAEPLGDGVEGLVYADIDLSQIALAKGAADPVGHYSRPDVARLWFNPNPGRIVEKAPRYAAPADDMVGELDTAEGVLDEAAE
ncbi:MAG: carbon-nitrogen hydrolase family protein [Pseudomonadota bacterium]